VAEQATGLKVYSEYGILMNVIEVFIHLLESFARAHCNYDVATFEVGDF